MRCNEGCTRSHIHDYRSRPLTLELDATRSTWFDVLEFWAIMAVLGAVVGTILGVLS